MIKGSNSSLKGYSQPCFHNSTDQIVSTVNNPDPEDPDNFKWVVDDLSEAGQYQTWHNVLNALEQEANSIRSNFENWKSSLAGADARRDEITKELAEIQARITKRSASKGAEVAKTAEQIDSAMTIKTKNEANSADWMQNLGRRSQPMPTSLEGKRRLRHKRRWHRGALMRQKI